MNEPSQTRRASTRDRRLPFRFSSVIETGLFLGIASLVNLYLFPNHYGFLNVSPHPFWLVVIMMSIRYGFREGVVCAGLTATVHGLFVILPEQGEYYFMTINLFSDFREPLLYLVVGGVVSGYTEHLLRRTEVVRARLRERQSELTESRARHRAAQEALQKLELRIAGQFNSMVDLFASLSETRRMRPEQIKTNLLEVLGTYLQVSDAVYCDIERNVPQVRHRFGESDRPSTPPDKDLVVEEVLQTGKVAHVGLFARSEDLARYEGSSLLAGPVISESGVVLGIVCIHKMPFLEYNPHSFKLFETILGWWGSVLEERLQMEEMQEKRVFNEELELYNFSYFWGRIFEEFRRSSRFSLPLSFSLIRIGRFTEVPEHRRKDLVRSLAQMIATDLSELEMASAYKTDDTIALTFPFLLAPDATERVDKISANIRGYALQPYAGSEDVLEIETVTADFQIGMTSCDELIAAAESQLGMSDETTAAQN